MAASLPLERIVRPFERAPINPPAQAPEGSSSFEPKDDIVLEFGKSGQVKTMQGSGSSSMSSFVKTESKEISRETIETRVENPADPSQYVMVQDTKSIEVESGSKDTYENQTIEFTKPQTP